MATTKPKPKQKQKTGTTGTWGLTGISGSIFLVGVLLVIAAIIWKATWARHPFHPEENPIQKIAPGKPADVKQSPTPSVAPLQTPIPMQTKVYNEPGDAALVSPAPDGWKAGDLDGITARIGPVTFSNGQQTCFVVHVYQFVPIAKPGGLYIIEPGMDATGTGHTIPEVIDQFKSQLNATRDSLDSLDASLLELKKMSAN